MNKRYLHITIVFLASVLSACSDFFEIERPPQEPWSTVGEFERAAIGAYAGLFGGHEWNMAWVNERIVKSSMGDDVGFVENPEWGYNRNSKDYNVYTERNFIQLYRVIATTNNALEFAESNGGNPFPGTTQADIDNNVNRIIGELHFIRGYAYYILITTFGHAFVPNGNNQTLDIPMPTRYARSVDEARNPDIGTTQAVYDLIIQDLQIARDMLPLQFDPTLHHSSYVVRANKFAAAAMLVRAYMQTAQYEKATAECDFIIDQNNGAYNLSEDPIQAFNKSSVSRGKEVIFYAPFFDQNMPPPSHLSVINHRWSAAQTPWVETYMSFSTVKRLGWMTAPETDTVVNDKAKNDKRFSQLMVVRYPLNKHLPNQAFEPRSAINTYTTIFANKYYRGALDNRTNVPLIRLAEIYLSRAWLRLRAGNANGAASDLNVVRGRAWDAQRAGSAYSPVSAADITEEMIHNERLIELFNEGDRIDYLRAVKAPVPLGDRGAGSEPYTSESFVWAIPTLELNFNDAL